MRLDWQPLARRSPNRPSSFTATRKCPFQHVASALGACRQAGISELGITVRIASAGARRVSGRP